MQKEELLNRLQSDPGQTLSSVFQDNRAVLLRAVADRMSVDIRGRVDPSDILQETFAEAFNRLGDYVANPSVPFLKWLFLLADQNTVAAYRKHVGAKMRSTSREQNVLADSQSFFANDLQRVAVCDHTGPLESYERSERSHQLERAISMLSPTSQTVVRMRFLDGKSLAEIAEALGMSVDAVSKRVMRSLITLSEFAKELGFTEV